MLTKQELFAVLRNNIDTLKTEFSIQKIGVFGSYVRGAQNESSDVDIYAEFSQPIGLKFISFAEHLESLVGKKADVLTKAGVQGIRNKRIAQNISESIEYV